MILGKDQTIRGLLRINEGSSEWYAGENMKPLPEKTGIGLFFKKRFATPFYRGGLDI